jgi:hypothetical protein
MDYFSGRDGAQAGPAFIHPRLRHLPVGDEAA